MERKKPITGNDRKYYRFSKDGSEVVTTYTDCHGNKRELREKLHCMQGNKKTSKAEQIYKVTEK
jgi:DNA-binding PadR family transcriptional regulator